MELSRLSGCNLVVTSKPWRFSEQYRVEIEQSWTAALADNPNLFDGDVFIVDQWSVVGGELTGKVLQAKFAAYLYWRNGGARGGEHYNEAFASALVVSADDGVFLARSVSGTLNAGCYGPPGGLIDARDVGRDGRLDFSAAAERELLEETGLVAGGMKRSAGFLLIRFGAYLAVVSVLRSVLAGGELIDRVDAYLGSVAVPELEAPRMIYRPGDLDGLPLTPYARLLATHGLGM